MQNHYETVFILTPVLSEDQVKETAQKFKDFLVSKGAELVHEDNWGLRKLAYKIKNKSTGFYQLFEYKVDTQVITEFEVQLRRDERVMRFLTVSLDNFGVEFNDRHRAKMKDQQVQGPKQIKEEETNN
ncbi:MAG: 30S ribosomal protein S6 [Bacteroidales bacterium]|nr:30S ribosomal protein S6 [Bacteroidales bacterium]